MAPNSSAHHLIQELCMRSLTQKLFLIAGAIALLSAAISASAQVTTATLFGNVTDPSGAVVANATVTMANVATNIATTVTANASGEYRFDLVPVGTYSVTVTAPGFKKFVQSKVPLTVNQEQRLDAPLALGAVTDTVTVDADPPQLNLESAVASRTIESREVDNLPILNRNIYNLFQLIPGVQVATQGNTLGYNQEVLQLNGGTSSNNNGTVSYYLDGGLNMTALRNTGNDMPNPEALEEFNVLTSNYDAEYGRMSSGVVTAITKSGGNKFHGSVYEFNRNTDFNAAEAAVYAAPTPFLANPPFHRNMYGMTVGGPIRRDKTFFFAEFAGVRQITPGIYSGSTLPTFSGGTTNKGEAGGDFSAFLPIGALATAACGGSATAFVVCSPTTHKPYTMDGIHASNIITDPLDATAANIVNNYLKNFENTTLSSLPSYTGSVPKLYNTYEFMGKIEHQLSPRQRLQGTYFYVNGLQTVPEGSSIPWVVQSQKWTQHVANLSDTFTINSRMINQAWVTFTRILGGRLNATNAGVSGRESLAAFGSNIGVQGPPSLSQITVSGYFTLSNAIDGPKAGTDFYSARDMFILHAGQHSLTFGGEYSLNKDDQVTDLNNYGVFGFSSSTTARTGNALSDFLLGQINSTSQDAPVDAIDNSFFYSLFAQDDWRIRPNLTLNLGLRWDVQTPATDPQNKESTFVPGQASTVNPLMPLGELVAGDKGVTRGTIGTPMTHFSPRVGFAWDPFGRGRTSVRGSGGIFWGGIAGNEWNASSNYYPFSLRYTFPAQGTLTNPYAGLGPYGGSPFPYVYTPGQVKTIVGGGAIEGVVPNFKWPRTYQLTASVQQQFTNQLALNVAYVGALGRDISLSVDKNYPVFNAATPSANTTGNVINRRPYYTGVAPNLLGQILAVEGNQTSNYNALEVTVSQRVTKGVSFNMFYTYSHGLDSNVLNSSSAPEDYNNPRIEKGNLDSDQRNVVGGSIIWEPNYFKANRITDILLDGWHISSVISLHSGTPYGISTGSDNNVDGNTTDRPNIIANPYFNTTRGSRVAEAKAWFNGNGGKAIWTPSASAQTPTQGASFCGYSTAYPTLCSGVGPGGSDGSMERNMLYGPGYRDIDLALFRDFKIYERVKLQIRAEASNVFNLVSLGNPNGTLSSSTAGSITSAQGNQRELQLGGRLTF
jgi:hypothetical protein